MTIYQDILHAKKHGKKLLAILLDPDKLEVDHIKSLCSNINKSIITHVFVGGSTDPKYKTDRVVKEIKQHTSLPVILFPGNGEQLTSYADGILFLSLISGRNTEYLIDQQVRYSVEVKKSALETIPTGYILIDGGNRSSVQKVSNTEPIDNKNTELIVRTALAGELLGKKMIYLESGSGAQNPVWVTNISAVSNEINIPVIVGGGIRNIHQLNDTYNAGATLAVIGTAFEENPELFNQIQKNIYEAIG